MNLRQDKYRANRIAGMSQYNSAKAAGYSEVTALKNTTRLEKKIKDSLINTLEQAGLTDKYQAKLLYELSLDEDAKVQLNAIKHVAELKKQTKTDINIDNSEHKHFVVEWKKDKNVLESEVKVNFGR